LHITTGRLSAILSTGPNTIIENNDIEYLQSAGLAHGSIVGVAVSGDSPTVMRNVIRNLIASQAVGIGRSISDVSGNGTANLSENQISDITGSASGAAAAILSSGNALIHDNSIARINPICDSNPMGPPCHQSVGIELGLGTRGLAFNVPEVLEVYGNNVSN